MLTKPLPILQSIIKSGDAQSAARATHIVRAIIDKKPDAILKQEDSRLGQYVEIYNRYASRTIDELKSELENINSLPAIDIIIILHLIESFKRPSKIQWPVFLRQKTRQRLYLDDDLDFMDALNAELPSSPPPR